jgi:hypothetical protein
VHQVGFIYRNKVSSSVIRISCSDPRNCKKTEIAPFPVKLLEHKIVINPLFLGDKSTYRHVQLYKSTCRHVQLYKSTYRHVQLYKATNIPDKIYSSVPTNPYTKKRSLFQIASSSILNEVRKEYLYTKCLLILV